MPGFLKAPDTVRLCGLQIPPGRGGRMASPRRKFFYFRTFTGVAFGNPSILRLLRHPTSVDPCHTRFYSRSWHFRATFKNSLVGHLLRSRGSGRQARRQGGSARRPGRHVRAHSRCVLRRAVATTFRRRASRRAVSRSRTRRPRSRAPVVNGVGTISSYMRLF